MYFTSGSDRAFEQLMQGKPGFDHYDSGEAVTPEDCGTCRFYRPHWKYQFCVYAECPYQPGKLTAYDAVTFRVKGVENMAVFRVERNKGYTVMSNHHLRNKDLSLKAKGLLSQMLSLPEDWDYSELKEQQLNLDISIFLEVLENLIDNAMRFSVQCVRVEFRYSQSLLNVCVHDDGKGFQPDELSKAVKPYYHGESVGTEHYGMGLYICKMLCEKHGGFLRVYNSPGGGACVEFNIAA